MPKEENNDAHGDAGFFYRQEKSLKETRSDSLTREITEELERNCGNCDNYFYYSSVGPAEGYCRVIPGEKRGQAGKKVRFNTDASKCSKFTPLQEVITDGREVSFDPHLRIYGDFEENT